LDCIVGKERRQPAPAYVRAYSTITLIITHLDHHVAVTSSSFAHTFLFPSLFISMMPKGMHAAVRLSETAYPLRVAV